MAAQPFQDNPKVGIAMEQSIVIDLKKRLSIAEAKDLVVDLLRQLQSVTDIDSIVKTAKDIPNSEQGV